MFFIILFIRYTILFNTRHMGKQNIKQFIEINVISEKIWNGLQKKKFFLYFFIWNDKWSSDFELICVYQKVSVNSIFYVTKIYILFTAKTSINSVSKSIEWLFESYGFSSRETKSKYKSVERFITEPNLFSFWKIISCS